MPPYGISSALQILQIFLHTLPKSNLEHDSTRAVSFKNFLNAPIGSLRVLFKQQLTPPLPR